MSGPASPSPPPAKRRKMSASPPASSSAASVLVPEASDYTPAVIEPDSLRPGSMSTDEVTEKSQPGAASSQPQSGLPHAMWPLDAVPVEIFNLIIRYLNRRDVQAMRLVSREFDSKLADTFFRNVVVPFRPEFEALYGTLNLDLGFSPDQQKYGLVLKKRADEPSATEDGDDNQARASPAAKGDESLLSDGYRVFEQFGRTHIKKFALALELDEMDLACPPVKLNQEIVPAPWGLYRWPIMDYQRYAQLEGIEKLADETQHMKRAFQFLRVVSEIGLSCDAGLGYLQGPDTNPLCRRVQPSVFRPTIYGDIEADSEAGSDEDSDRSMGLIILKQMAMNAGYDSNEWPRAVLRLLEDEGRAVKWVEQISASGEASHQKLPLFEVTKDTTKEDIIKVIEGLVGDDDQETVTSAAHARVYGLCPNNLTTSQVEMLLELEWAHRALMDSYVIAVMDNRDSFQALSTLTIARCSGRHVPSLMKKEFWGTMTCLRSFHLGVIPDWRRLHKDDTGGVSQTRISPIETYRAVFNLLHSFVGEQKNIKHVSFEWISGGEFAVGKSQRDRYIMPAPVLADAPSMVDLQHSLGEQDVINLPCVEKLSLKNCWLTPHVFLNVFKKMSREMLRDLELETVSLTGPPSKANEPSIHPGPQGKPSHWPWPLCVGGEPGSWFQLQRPAAANNNNNNNNVPGHAPHAMHAAALAHAAAAAAAAGAGAATQNLPAMNGWGQNGHHLLAHHGSGAVAVNQASAPVQQDAQTSTIPKWRLFSWPHILASLDMSPEAVHAHINCMEPDDDFYRIIKTNEQRFSTMFREVLENRGGQDRLKTITFKSCGYALIESSHINNWKIIPNESLLVQHDTDLPSQLKDLDTQMLICNDGLLGKILNYIPEKEQRILSGIFGLSFGWDDIYDDIVSQIAIMDGNPDPGAGRFHGTDDVVPMEHDDVEDDHDSGLDDGTGGSDDAGFGLDGGGDDASDGFLDDFRTELDVPGGQAPDWVSRTRDIGGADYPGYGLTAENLAFTAADLAFTEADLPPPSCDDDLGLTEEDWAMIEADLGPSLSYYRDQLSSEQQVVAPQDAAAQGSEQMVLRLRGGHSQSTENKDPPQDAAAQGSEQMVLRLRGVHSQSTEQHDPPQNAVAQSSEQQGVASQDGLPQNNPAVKTATDTAPDNGQNEYPLIDFRPGTGT